MKPVLNSPLFRLTILVVGLIGLWAVGYLLAEALAPPQFAKSREVASPQVTSSPGVAAQEKGAETGTTPDDKSIISQIFGEEPSTVPRQDESRLTRTLRIVARLGLAALLSTILAFRPRKNMGILRKNPYVAESQILLAVVASALMMIVADSAARAFGIFAAASLVRFRTNIRDPKEITVLLLSLGLGLATGVGKWELAILLSLFVLLLLALLEHFEVSQVYRAMELKVKSHDVDDSERLVARILEKHRLPAEVREVDRPDEQDPLGRIVFHVSLDASVSVQKLSDEILAADSRNIDSVEWHQKKSHSYIYR